MKKLILTLSVFFFIKINAEVVSQVQFPEGKWETSENSIVYIIKNKPFILPQRVMIIEPEKFKITFTTLLYYKNREYYKDFMTVNGKDVAVKSFGHKTVKNIQGYKYIINELRNKEALVVNGIAIKSRGNYIYAYKEYLRKNKAAKQKELIRKNRAKKAL